MESAEAKVLIKNLLKRIRQTEEDSYELRGGLTDDEVAALKLAHAVLGGDHPTPLGRDPQDVQQHPSMEGGADELRGSAKESEWVSEKVSPEMAAQKERVPSKIEIDTNTLYLPSPPSDRRLCMDFGTAMSKVTLVRDQTAERGYEDIEVLRLGVPGDQEEISETMLVSSVFIDGDGLLWFGQMAVQRSQLEAQTGDRQRLDNIKRYLSEEGLGSEVSYKFNPTNLKITYGDMVLAYLMFLSWAVNYCLEESDEPRNLNRRFAMPCFVGSKARYATRTISEMLVEAQLLSDTFFNTLPNGIPLGEFLEAVDQVRSEKRTCNFVGEDITEPLGVAGAIMSWERPVNSLIMVVDVGAGTSDFSLYRMRYDNTSGQSFAYEVADSAENVTEAGNYLDTLLKGLILRKAGVDSDHPHWINIQGNLELDLRDYKERLFIDGEVSVRLFNDQIVTITRDEFLALPQVEKFSQSLKECRDRILERVDPSFVRGAPHGALGLALTGGGASLPMVKELAQGTVTVAGSELKLVQTKEFPSWLEEEFPDLEEDYPRIAVSLGGARKQIIDQGGIAHVTAGDVKASPQMGGYYTRG